MGWPGELVCVLHFAARCDVLACCMASRKPPKKCPSSVLAEAPDSQECAAPSELATSSASTVADGGEDSIADGVLAMLRDANVRADKAFQQSRQARKRHFRRSQKIRKEAEALLSTDVLRAIVQRREDAGEIICTHCKKSLQLAELLPREGEPIKPLDKRRKRDAPLLLAPKPRTVAPARAQTAPTMTSAVGGIAALAAKTEEAEMDDLAAVLFAEAEERADEEEQTPKEDSSQDLFDEMYQNTSPMGHGDSPGDAEVAYRA